MYSFSKEILSVDNSIRWVGIANKFGVLINAEYREGLQLLMSEEENEEYASLTVTRYKTRVKFQSKIGKLIYAFGKYEKLCRVTIHINDDYFLLLTLDSKIRNFDEILTEKVIPLVQERKLIFADDEKSKG
ncbi:MAG: hypothetical protein WBQ25_18655 [Nitrososphaeraceae archaeon]